jgi:hypothetical protein
VEQTGTLAEADWESHRPAVFGAAYRILGIVAEAEDVTQEVWLRAAAGVLVDESVSTAMLVVMERLTPAERVALVLHDVFDFPFGRIAEVLGGTPAASRKLASRARARVAAVEERPRASRAETERVLRAFKAAADAGDMAGLIELLHPEAVYVGDGGGKVTAARRPGRGGEPIALLAIRSIEIRRPDAFRIIEVNGRPALATYRGGELVWLDTVEIADGRITAFRRLANPEKLAHLGHI